MDYQNNSINLNENQIAEINKLLEGTDITPESVQEIIATVLGVQDDSDFRFGSFGGGLLNDPANRPEEQALEKLVEQFLSERN